MGKFAAAGGEPRGGGFDGGDAVDRVADDGFKLLRGRPQRFAGGARLKLGDFLFGDVGMQGHRAAFGGMVLADPDPPAVLELMHDRGVGGPVPGDALGDKRVLAPDGLGEQTAGDGAADDLLEMTARQGEVRHFRIDLAVVLVADEQAVVLVPQHEAVVQAVHGVGQALAGGAGGTVPLRHLLRALGEIALGGGGALPQVFYPGASLRVQAVHGEGRDAETREAQNGGADTAEDGAAGDDDADGRCRHQKPGERRLRRFLVLRHSALFPKGAAPATSGEARAQPKVSRRVG